jgi:hypothetical protein
MNKCPLLAGRTEYTLPKDGELFASIPEACVPCFNNAVASPDATTKTNPAALAQLEASVRTIGDPDLSLDYITFESLERPTGGSERVARLMLGKRYPAAFDVQAFFEDTIVSFDCPKSD